RGRTLSNGFFSYRIDSSLFKTRRRIMTHMGTEDMRASKHTRQQDKGDDRRDCRRNGRQLFLPMVPSEILDQEHAHASQHVHHEQKDEAAFGKLHRRLIAPAQKLFERGLAFDCKPERQEVERKENGERQAGQPVHEGGDPKHALAVSQYGHGNTTATTARAPRRNNSTPKAPAKMPAYRDLTATIRRARCARRLRREWPRQRRTRYRRTPKPGCRACAREYRPRSVLCGLHRKSSQHAGARAAPSAPRSNAAKHRGRRS